uniref:Uncharacterized protein n=1 Tax=Pithovirus LCPAC404 TaxID=2506597 RepID=A0A481ZC11_9VIRU|nr:MAG: hypothetical protein LCPAC404_00210 [Pithovirus LCPAC404]
MSKSEENITALNISSVDQAIYNRVSIVPFLPLFKGKEQILINKEENKNGENIFDVDPFFDKKIPGLAQERVADDDEQSTVDKSIKSPEKKNIDTTIMNAILSLPPGPVDPKLDPLK